MKTSIYAINRKLQSTLGFSFPIPIRNHFYKRCRITFKKNWFCKTCSSIFDLKPWSIQRKKKLDELCCPVCSSKSIHWHTDAFKLMIDKRPIENIKEFFENIKQQNT